MLLVVLPLLLLLLCGAGQATHHTMDMASDGVGHYLQRVAAEDAGLYLPMTVSPTSPCGHALTHMAAALANNSLWAAAMVDSWGKFVDGVYFGNKYNGVFDECLAAASPDGVIKGKYCRIHTYGTRSGKTATPADHHLPWGRATRKLDFSLVKKWEEEARNAISMQYLPANIEYGTCMPSVCTQDELQNSLSLHITSDGVLPIVMQCSEKNTEEEFTDGDVGFMALVTFLLVLIGCASLVDIYLQYSGRESLAKGALRYLLVFSAYTNLPKMLQVNPKASPGNITCLSAMRTLSMTWVIWCHQQTIPYPNMANIMNILQKYEGILAQTILNGYPSVDTFFFLSGLLVSYSVLREVKRTRSFNIVLFYFHRVLRLVPAIGIMCGFVATVMRFFVAGPFAWIWTVYWQPTCAKNWWKDVIFVDNFLTDNGSCLGQTWYIAADMQMYLVAPFIILPLYFLKSFGKVWMFLVTAASAIIPAAIIYINDLPPTELMGIDQDLSGKYMSLVYLPPWTRISPWLAGVWLGYIFFRQGNIRYRMKPLVVAVGWTLAAITGLLVVFGLKSYNHFINPVQYEVMTSVVYGGGHRLAWGAALAWVVFACHNGYGGVVDNFLSHPVWQPISRLTYTTYLVAFPLQYFLFYNTKGGVFYFTHLNTLIMTVGAIVLCLPWAVLLSLMAESPIVGLEKLLFRPNHSSPPRKAAGGKEGDTLAPSSPQRQDLEDTIKDTAEDTTKTTKDTTITGFSNPVFIVEDGGNGVAGKNDTASVAVTPL